MSEKIDRILQAFQSILGAQNCDFTKIRQRHGWNRDRAHGGRSYHSNVCGISDQAIRRSYADDCHASSALRLSSAFTRHAKSAFSVCQSWRHEHFYSGNPRKSPRVDESVFLYPAALLARNPAEDCEGRLDTLLQRCQGRRRQPLRKSLPRGHGKKAGCLRDRSVHSWPETLLRFWFEI